MRAHTPIYKRQCTRTQHATLVDITCASQVTYVADNKGTLSEDKLAVCSETMQIEVRCGKIKHATTYLLTFHLAVGVEAPCWSGNLIFSLR